MAIADVDRYAKLAMLPGLEAARNRIEEQIQEIRRAVWPSGRPARAGSSAATGKRGSKRRGLTAAGRKRLSELMKARWAQRRAAARKSSRAKG